MKTERNILIAFILNLAFSVFEFAGGLFTGSVAIVSDALHDLADAASIGISYFLERKSKKQPDQIYTYGYARFSVLGSVITTSILLVGSVLVMLNAIHRIIQPTTIHYDGMILFAIVGACVNLAAAFVTREGDSLNQKAVNLHMLEDVLGWIVVLIGAIVMRFTDFSIIDPIMSIGIALFIMVNAGKNLLEVADLFLEKIPQGIRVEEIKSHLCHIDGVLDVHHIHIWSLDGQRNYATMHIVANADSVRLKQAVREELAEHGIHHVTLELESQDEHCDAETCVLDCCHHAGHHHHHHHHHHGHHHH